MNSVVSLRAFANVSNVPIVAFMDTQPEHVASPRLLTVSAIDRSPGKCRRPFAEDPSCPSMPIDLFHRNHKVIYPCDASAGHALEDVSAVKVHRTASKASGLYGEDAWITSTTLPCKLENGKNAGG